MKIIIEPPTEVNPVDLIRLTQQRMPNLTYKDFAIAFGCEPGTIAKWMCGIRQPSQPHRILAAVLKSRWFIDNN